MSRHKKVTGVCKICKASGKLSFEHVPPAAAFNNGNYFYTAELGKILEKGDSNFEILTLKDKSYTKKKQGGVGFYTLCTQCNNDTGSWYGSFFVDWIYQSMGILLKSKGKPTLYYPTFFFPLRVFKQIITMFMSIANDAFLVEYSVLEKYLKQKEQTDFPDNIKIYCYYNIEGTNRYIGNILLGDLNTNTQTQLLELSFPPIGLVMTIDSPCPDSRLTDITHFSKYNYNDWIDHFQKFETLPTHLPFSPADYRSKTEIEATIKENSR
ncbi:MAG: hypothetical protein V4539_21030 [Bacteroidota bacterium]